MRSDSPNAGDPFADPVPDASNTSDGHPVRPGQTYFTTRTPAVAGGALVQFTVSAAVAPGRFRGQFVDGATAERHGHDLVAVHPRAREEAERHAREMAPGYVPRDPVERGAPARHTDPPEEARQQLCLRASDVGLEVYGWANHWPLLSVNRRTRRPIRWDLLETLVARLEAAAAQPRRAQRARQAALAYIERGVLE